jgi:hypothetical protein
MSKTASWRNGYRESGFAGKGFMRMPSIAGVSPPMMPACPIGCWQMLTLADKEQHQRVHHRSPSHRVVPHRVSRTLNFGQLVSGFNCGRSAGRSG